MIQTIDDPTLAWPLLSRRASRNLPEFSLSKAIYSSLVSGMLQAPAAIHEQVVSGFAPLSALELALEADLGRLVARTESQFGVEAVYTSRDAAARIRADTDDVTVWLAVTDRERLAELAEKIGALVSMRPPSGRVAVLAKDNRNNIVVMHLAGSREWAFERGNYSDDVVTAFRHIRADLRGDDPCGRLVVLSGPPGTGKSHFLRAIVSEVDALFLFVAPTLMGKVSAPEVIMALLEQRHRKTPIVLILEDADQVLVSRDPQSLELVSDLCNLSDGFLAETIDLRIVATTNASRLSLDDAVARPGRLCTYAAFASLPLRQASDVYRRLTGIEMPTTRAEHLTLAEIYRTARGAGWMRPARSEPAAGF